MSPSQPSEVYVPSPTDGWPNGPNGHGSDGPNGPDGSDGPDGPDGHDADGHGSDGPDGGTHAEPMGDVLQPAGATLLLQRANRRGWISWHFNFGPSGAYS